MVYVRKLWEIHQCYGCEEVLIVNNCELRYFFFKPDVDRWQMVRKEVILAIRMFL